MILANRLRFGCRSLLNALSRLCLILSRVTPICAPIFFSVALPITFCRHMISRMVSPDLSSASHSGPRSRVSNFARSSRGILSNDPVTARRFSRMVVIFGFGWLVRLAGFPVVAPGLRRVAMNPKGALWRHCGMAVDPSGTGRRLRHGRRECKQVTEVTPVTFPGWRLSP